MAGLRKELISEKEWGSMVAKYPVTPCIAVGAERIATLTAALFFLSGSYLLDADTLAEVHPI